jgi:predicted secreted protein
MKRKLTMMLTHMIKTRYSVSFFCCITVLLLYACTLPGSVASAEISCDRFYASPHITESLEVEAGDEFVVKLCSNPSTGFQWVEMADFSNPDVVEQVSHQQIGPSEDSDSPPGTPGNQVWRFKAIKSGRNILSFEYSRNWEGGEKGEWTYELTVNVE